MKTSNKTSDRNAAADNLPCQEAAVQTLDELWARVGCHVLVRRAANASGAQTSTKLNIDAGTDQDPAAHSPTDLGRQDHGTSDRSPSDRSPIPTEQERPRYVVLGEPYTAADGNTYRAGVWWFGLKSGKGDNPPTLVQSWICSPLHVDAVTHDSAGANFGRLLRFRNTLGQWKTWAMPMEMLSADTSELRGVLLSMGVHLDPSYAGRNSLATYLQSQAPTRTMEAVMQTGWAGGQFKAFALPDTVIGPQAGKVTFQAQHLHSDEYSQRGTLEGWRNAIAAPAAGNPVLVLSLCSAFAGPVLALVGAESGGIHLIGDSSTGKTTALQGACSVMGGDSYRRSWRATANGLEASASLFNDSLLALDEISECDPRDVGEVVYMLGNGRGKQRASRAGGARAVARWRTSVLSTGEHSIATSMQEAGQRIKAGQTVRLLDIPVQRTHGAWDNLHGHPNGPAFSDAIKRASRQQYGTAGRAFLEKLSRDTNSLAERLESIKAHLLEGADSRDGQPTRAAALLAVMALAGELATAYGITGWDDGEATSAAKVGFAAWLAQRGEVSGNSEQHQITQAVRDFIDRHGDSRFSNANAMACDDLANRVPNRAGWWCGVGNSTEYWFTGEGMREALKGFDFNRALKVLRTAGLLDAPPTGRISKSKRIHGRFVRVYVVRPDQVAEVDAPA